MTAKLAAQRWGEERERQWYQELTRPVMKIKEVPRFEEFWPRFLDGHVRANRQKPSGIAASESIAKWHLIPAGAEA
jgi:hypothetical protein